MNSREVALNIINRVLIEGAYSNLVLSNELNESDLNEKDRALATELVYGTIRRKKTLDIDTRNKILAEVITDMNTKKITVNNNKDFSKFMEDTINKINEKDYYDLVK